MATSFNKVLLMGNLTRNPELRYIAGGSAVCEFGIAINRRFTANGQEREETTFVDIVVWSRAAESCNRFLVKGSSVFIEGRLQLDQWEDQQGAKRSRLRVVAENVQFLSGTRRDGDAPPDRPQGDYRQNSYQRNDGNYQRGDNRPQGNYPRNENPPPPRQPNAAPPVPDEAFDVNDEVEDDIPF